VAGEGEQRQELETFCQTERLEDCVQWLGWIDYGQLGTYFRYVDVFVLPTLEDVWGMVVLEAMAFGKPVLCSKFAGASELIFEGENGYLFDPHQSEKIADILHSLIDSYSQNNIIVKMGDKSQELIAQHTPIAAAKFLAKVTDSTMVRGKSFLH
jgi:glycosyltransferase involved in cell wall biosynthesis